MYKTDTIIIYRNSKYKKLIHFQFAIVRIYLVI